MKTLLFFLVVILLPALGHAQNFEYGKPAELKGLTRAYIDVGVDIKSFEEIKKIIQNAKLSQLTIVDSIKESDFVLMFRGGKEAVLVDGDSDLQKSGKGVVAIPSASGDRLRILISFESLQNRIGEAKPSTKFAKEFVKAYKEANRLK